jgi:hypothetical protein
LYEWHCWEHSYLLFLHLFCLRDLDLFIQSSWYWSKAMPWKYMVSAVISDCM